MENGSFHTHEADERVKAIALPNQLPKGIDFSEIPISALKSSTLETLISQNEDLMARLTMSLRKTSDFEEKASNFEREAQALRLRFDALKEQYLVLHEKDRLASQRNTQLLEESSAARIQVAKLEKGYSDIFLQAQAFQRRLIQLERYRARVKKASRSIHARLKELVSIKQTLETNRIRQRTLIESYEARIQDAYAQVESLRSKASERDRLFGEKVEIENQLVFEQRQSESFRLDAQERLQSTSTEARELRVQVKELLVDNEGKKQELARLQYEVPNLQANQKILQEQVESLQALWNHKQIELEQLTEKNKSLQKLNQNLGINLNQQRKEIHALNTTLEKERFESQEKVKVLMQEIALLRSQSQPG